jgi:hypothetical protein
MNMIGLQSTNKSLMPYKASLSTSHNLSCSTSMFSALKSYTLVSRVKEVKPCNNITLVKAPEFFLSNSHTHIFTYLSSTNPVSKFFIINEHKLRCYLIHVVIYTNPMKNIITENALKLYQLNYLTTVEVDNY